MNKPSLLLLAGTLGLMAVSSADADSPYPRATHEFALGATRQRAESKVLSSVPGLPEVGIDLKDLNVDDDDTSWFLQYSWRFRERWLLEAFTYQYQDSGQAAATGDFNYDGVEFTAGAALNSELEIDTYAVDILYAVHQGPRTELLVGGGIHALDFTASFQGLVSAADMTEVFTSSSDTLLAPVPNLRARGTIAFSNRLGADLTVGWLSANVDDYDGSFAYAHARLRYRVGERSSFSLGYQYTGVDVSRKPGGGRERSFDADLHGPSLELNFAF